jgi:hypothetical protein
MNTSVFPQKTAFQHTGNAIAHSPAQPKTCVLSKSTQHKIKGPTVTVADDLDSTRGSCWIFVSLKKHLRTRLQRIAWYQESGNDKDWEGFLMPTAYI